MQVMLPLEEGEVSCNAVNLRVVRETSGTEQSPSICGQAIEDPRTSEFTSTGIGRNETRNVASLFQQRNFC
jgi:hypothetical protein